MNTKSVYGAWMILALAAGAATAQEISPRVTLEAIHSDNTQNSHTAPIDATALDALAGVRVDRTGPQLDLDLDFSVLHRSYFPNKLSSETLPSGNGVLRAAFVPERLTWVASDNVGQISSQPFALKATDRQNVNVFSTGPDLDLPLAGRNRLELRLRYGLATYQTSNIDSHRYGGEFGFGHSLSESSTLSVNYGAQKVDYQQNALYPSIDTDKLFLRYALESARTFLAADGGSESVRVAGGERKTTPHLLLVLERRVSPRLTLNAEYEHRYSDVAENLRADLLDNFRRGGDQNVQALAAPFKSDRGYVMLVRSAARIQLAWEVTGNRERYPFLTALNRDIYGSDVAVDYQLSPRWTAVGRLRWEREMFPNTDLSDSRFRLSLGLTRQLSRSLQTVLAVQRVKGTGSVAANEFSENRVTLSINYLPRGMRARVFEPNAQFRLYEQPRRGSGAATPAAPQNPAGNAGPPPGG
jgi:hypothetical protein